MAIIILMPNVLNRWVMHEARRSQFEKNQSHLRAENRQDKHFNLTRYDGLGFWPQQSTLLEWFELFLAEGDRASRPQQEWGAKRRLLKTGCTLNFCEWTERRRSIWILGKICLQFGAFEAIFITWIWNSESWSCKAAKHWSNRSEEMRCFGRRWKPLPWLPEIDSTVGWWTTSAGAHFDCRTRRMRVIWRRDEGWWREVTPSEETCWSSLDEDAMRVIQLWKFNDG